MPVFTDEARATSITELQENAMGNAGFAAICEALKTSHLPVETLNCSSNEISDLSKLSDVLKENGRLVNVELNDNAVTEIPDDLLDAVLGTLPLRL